ncbi:hypothetical protein P3339_11820 [Microbulbifer sp. MLAF003]|uniref:hypothetical protein n=1 Tax=Microbulbifer sp. MLAF003 TaxID=3032582 RepID=UPI0024AD7E59|nr:hypothetical protein [Microbulbifer sp. MLAF003]WHI49177.1 hypothetical protein P3339_11820 [Microbulbifer sp. MLAF003]
MFVLILPAYAHAGLWDKFTTWVVDTWDTVEVRVEEVIEDIVTTVEDGVTAAIGFFVDTGEWIYDGLTTVVEGSLNFFYGVADGTVTALNYFGLNLDISDWFTTGGRIPRTVRGSGALQTMILPRILHI